MPAIVRQTMSRRLAKDLLEDLKGTTNSYYIGIAKSDPFNVQDTVVDPIDSPRVEREFRNGLQSIKAIEDATFVAKRVNWSSGSRYAAWDDSIPSDIVEPWTPWYVMNDAKEVYVCMVAPTDLSGNAINSTVEPNWGFHAPMSAETDPTAPMYNVREWWKPFTTTDGYVWKFLYTLTPERIFQFLSSNHIPVQEAEPDLPTGDSIEDLQTTVKMNAIGGQILALKVDVAGEGYTTAPTIIIDGDGTGAQATAIMSGDGILKVVMDDFGSGYTNASVRIIGDGTTEAVLSPVITSPEGLGYNPINDLKTSSIMTNIKPDGDVNGTFLVDGTEFRQMGLIRNPVTPTGDAFTAQSANVLPTMTLASASTFESGRMITSTSGASAWVDGTDGETVYFHQNEETGFKDFDTSGGEVINQEGQVAVALVSVEPQNGIDRSSGDVLYIESRHRIRRDAEQQEDIKIVITV
jgi:hypothetical protein